jgi:hypothetical protein
MNCKINYLFNHPHNETILNERCVEIPLGLKYIDFVEGDLIEVGAVTPYYIKSNHDCLDPTDKKANIKKLAENYDFTKKNVLSISTLEHIGVGDYKLKKETNLAYEVTLKIYKESKTCLIGWPIGYNYNLDKTVKENIDNYNYMFYIKTGNYTWEYVNGLKGFSYKYNYPFKKGNSIIFLYKGFRFE